MKNIEEEKKESTQFQEALKKQAKVTREFAYLEDCDIKDFQAAFVLAQAKEVCKYLTRLNLSPFKAWENLIKSELEHPDKDFLYQLYITKNEFEQYVPDEGRIKELVLKEPDAEEYPEFRK